MRAVVDGAAVNEKQNTVTIEIRAWKNLLMTQSELSELIRDIEDPPGTEARAQDTGTD